MKFYKVFDYNSQYIAFWGSDLLKVVDDWKSYVNDNYADEYDKNDEVEVRAFDTRDINSDEYKDWDSEGYFSELSVPVEKYVLKSIEDSSYSEAGYLEWVKV